WTSGRNGIWNRHYPERLLRLADSNVRFISVSSELRQKAIAFGIPARLVDVQPIGIDVKYFVPNHTPPSKRENRVLFVGRLVEKKGCRFLIEAASQVTQRVPNLKLVIAGDGPLRPELISLAQES